MSPYWIASHVHVYVCCTVKTNLRSTSSLLESFSSFVHGREIAVRRKTLNVQSINSEIKYKLSFKLHCSKHKKNSIYMYLTRLLLTKLVFLWCANCKVKKNSLTICQHWCTFYETTFETNVYILKIHTLKYQNLVNIFITQLYTLQINFDKNFFSRHRKNWLLRQNKC